MKLRPEQLGCIASVAVMLSISACSSTGSKVSDGSDAALKQAERQQASLSNSAKGSANDVFSGQQQSAAQAGRDTLSGQKLFTGPTIGAAMQNSGAGVGNAELLPPNAKAGQCFTRIWQAPEYKTVSVKKLVSEASENIEVVPAKYGKVSKRILIQEASTRLVPVPATYKNVTEQVLVQPARSVTETIAAVYENSQERIIDKPAHTVWKQGTGPIQRIDSSTGEIMCLVEVPATYKTINKRMLKRAASTKVRELPAQYKTVSKRIVATPATTRVVEIPAKYETVSITEELQPAKQQRVVIPAKYADVTQREMLTAGRMDWREILCETNTTPDRIVKIQRALQSAGFNPGPIDGGLGPSTINAVNAFQRSKGLPVDRYLNVETVHALGVSTK